MAHDPNQQDEPGADYVELQRRVWREYYRRNRERLLARMREKYKNDEEYRSRRLVSAHRKPRSSGSRE